MPASPRTACEDVRCDLIYGHSGQHVASRDSSRQALREALDGAIGAVKVSGHIEALPASHYAGHVEVRLHEWGFAIVREAEAMQQASPPPPETWRSAPLDVEALARAIEAANIATGWMVDPRSTSNFMRLERTRRNQAEAIAAEYARLAPTQPAASIEHRSEARPADEALREAIEEARETWYERHNRPEWVQRHGYAMDKLGRAALAHQPTSAEDAP